MSIQSRCQFFLLICLFCVRFLGCTTSQSTQHGLFSESFNEQNGVKCKAHSGEYAHSKDADALIVPLDEIGLIGSQEYTIEFYWLPERPKVTQIDAILFKNLASFGPSLRCYVGPEHREWHNMVFEVGDYPIRLHVVRATHYRQNVWQHIVLAGDFVTGRHYLYVNGVEKGFQTRGYSNDGWRNVEIGFVSQTGFIDDIAIYDKFFQIANTKYRQRGW